MSDFCLPNSIDLSEKIKKKYQKWPTHCLFQWDPNCAYYLSKTFSYAFRWKLNFNHHLKEKIAKPNKGIGLIRKLAHVFPRQSLLAIYKSLIRPHLGYGGIIYDQLNNETFAT